MQRQTNFNLVIGFGAIVGIGCAIAVYKLLTSRIFTEAFNAIVIALAALVCVGAFLAVAFAAIRVNHLRGLWSIERAAKRTALEVLNGQQTAIHQGQGTLSDTQMAIQVLYGSARILPGTVASQQLDMASRRDERNAKEPYMVEEKVPDQPRHLE